MGFQVLCVFCQYDDGFFGIFLNIDQDSCFFWWFVLLGIGFEIWIEDVIVSFLVFVQMGSFCKVVLEIGYLVLGVFVIVNDGFGYGI